MTRCPDGGACHHECATKCYRVTCCGPLSGVYPDNQWPPGVVAQHRTDETMSEHHQGWKIVYAYGNGLEIPPGWDIDVDDSDEGGQPNGSGVIEPSNAREWYSDEREDHHRSRLVITVTGPWREGPTELARRMQVWEAERKAAELIQRENEVLAAAERIKKSREASA